MQGEGEVHEGEPLFAAGKSMMVVWPHHDQVAGFQGNFLTVDEVGTAAGFHPEYFGIVVIVQGKVLPGMDLYPGEVEYFVIADEMFKKESPHFHEVN